MTLIIGVKCKTGVVLASDGAATFGRLDGTTIRQDVKKLKIIRNQIVVGTSGPVGLGQRFAGELEECYNHRELANKEPHQAMTIISSRFRKHIISEQKAAQSAIGLIGASANTAWITSALVALPIKSQLCLFEFDHMGGPEEKTEDLPFVSIGSGQITADPFLAFLRKMLFPKGLPDFSRGILFAVWTLKHVIETSPGGVSEPIQVVILGSENKGFKARELDRTELGEHEEYIKTAEEGFVQQLTSIPEETIPPPPEPPK